jgi:hypothetical protein
MDDGTLRSAGVGPSRSVRVSAARCVLLAAIALSVAALSTPAVATVGDHPDDTWQTDGPVWSIARAGTRIYLAGDFRSLTDGQGHSVARAGLAALDAASGAPIRSWTPSADDLVRAIAPSADGTKIYVGGDFDRIDGRPRRHLAAIRASDGSLIDAWMPSTSGGVNDIEVYGSTVYVGGNFGSVSGVDRERLAAITAGTGEVIRRFDPRPGGSVRGLSMAPEGGALYVAGDFSSVGGASRRNAAAVDPATGTVRNWRPDPSYPLLGIAASRSRIYLAGAGPGGTLGAFEALPGDDEVWDVHADGNMQAVGFLGPTVYAGGHFDEVEDSVRHKLFAVSADTGDLRPWNPGANSSVGVRSIVGYGNKVYIGGEFTVVDGRRREGFAQFTDLRL